MQLSTSLTILLLLLSISIPIYSQEEAGKAPKPKEKIYGVNLGGWLVLERFITPSLIEGRNDPNIHDEYTLALFTGNRTIFEHHWDTWVTKEELIKLKNSGINAVRIPVGKLTLRYISYNRSMASDL